MNKSLVWLGWIIGSLLIALSILYFITPASSLPSFIPGYESAVSKIHYKHGIGALFLGLAFFAYSWFQGGKKSDHTSSTQSEE